VGGEVCFGLLSYGGHHVVNHVSNLEILLVDLNGIDQVADIFEVRTSLSRLLLNFFLGLFVIVNLLEVSGEVTFKNCLQVLLIHFAALFLFAFLTSLVGTVAVEVRLVLFIIESLLSAAVSVLGVLFLDVLHRSLAIVSATSLGLPAIALALSAVIVAAVVVVTTSSTVLHFHALLFFGLLKNLVGNFGLLFDRVVFVLSFFPLAGFVLKHVLNKKLDTETGFVLGVLKTHCFQFLEASKEVIKHGLLLLTLLGLGVGAFLLKSETKFVDKFDGCVNRVIVHI